MSTVKKTVKIQTPIDERETFVSLKKSFAESEQDVQEKLKNLYELQTADNEIEKLVQLRGELPEEVKALEEDILALKAKHARIEDIIEGYGQTIESSNVKIGEIDEEVEKYRKQMENVSNSREYDSINKEIEDLTLERSICEKNIRESRQAIMDRKADLERVAERLSVREGDLEAKNEELSSIVESTSKEEEVLRAKREEYASKIDARTLSAYNRIRASVLNRLAVVTLVNENACGGCFSTVTPQRMIDIASGKKLVICEHCGRIIVSPEI